MNKLTSLPYLFGINSSFAPFMIAFTSSRIHINIHRYDFGRLEFVFIFLFHCVPLTIHCQNTTNKRGIGLH